MSKKVKLAITVTMVYEADKDNYQECDRTPERMAQIERDACDDDLGILIGIMEANPFELTINPIEA